MPDAPRCYLSGFGKHPAWNDHLDDIGLVTASLIEARRILYGGIAQQIESAAWERAGADKVAPVFDHIIYWRRPEESLTGVIWSSRDGKGRSLYPMLLIAHCVSQPYSWVAREVLPALAAAAAKCRSTTSAEDVIATLNDTQQSLRSRTLPSSPPDAQTGVAAWARFFAGDQTALRRILHHLRGNMVSFAPGSNDWCAGENQARSARVRLPQIPGAKPAESLHAWLAFFESQLDATVPILGLLPADGNWLDIVVGEPAPADFFVLRALPTSVPLVTDIPYQLDAAVQTGWNGLMADVVSGRLPSVSCLNGEAAETNRDAAAKRLARFRSSTRTGFFGRFRSSAGQ